MSRQGSDVVENGVVKNGYDYKLQVWVLDFKIQNCGHPKSMHPGCCNADKLQGKRLVDVKK